MLITFHCPQCRAKLETEAGHAGSRVDCPSCRAPVTVPRKGLEAGTTVGGFRIVELLGRGGMAEVYLARQLSMDRLVALKVLPTHLCAQPDFVERFLHEVRLAARLEHPNLVTAYEAGEDGGVLYLAMAYVKGESLHDRVRRLGPLPEGDALAIARKLAGALQYAWAEHRLLHRDVKPANVLLDAKGEPKLADLGLARSLRLSSGLTIAETVVGTPNYMSPEQAEGSERLDFRTDLFALGTTLYTALTARIPFEAPTLVETMRKQATEPLADPRRFCPRISPACVGLLEVVLARNPRGRPHSWEAFAADVDRVLALQPPASPPPAPGESALLVEGPRAAPPPDPRLAGRLRGTMLGLLLLILALGALAVGLYVGRDRPEPSRDPVAAPLPPTPAIQDPAAGPAAPGPAAPTAAAPSPERAAFPEGRPRGGGLRNPAGALFLEAFLHAQRNPNDYDGLLARLRRIQDKFGGDPAVARRAAAQIASVEKARHAAQEAARPARAERDEAARRARVGELLAPVADAILRRDLPGASARLADARTPDLPAASAAELDRAGELLGAIADAPEAMLRAFGAQGGQTVAIEFRDGRREKLFIAGVDGAAVVARKDLPEGFAEIRFAVADLAPAEQWRRLGSGEPAAQAAARGYLAAAAGDWAAAAAQFAECPGALGAALAKSCRARSAP